jgi:hypothetical protein
MEKDNKKSREDARRDYNDTVRVCALISNREQDVTLHLSLSRWQDLCVNATLVIKHILRKRKNSPCKLPVP